LYENMAQLLVFYFLVSSGTLDTTPQHIPLVEINASRLQANKILHFGQSSIDKKILTENRNLTLGDVFNRTSNLFATSTENFSQDLRISLRGSGMRSAFGIRGVKILVDGVPESTPDGQGDVDNIEAHLISGVNIQAGPANAIYGNASGGVVELSTNNAPLGTHVKSINTIGSHGLIKSNLQISQGSDRLNLLGAFTYTKIDGYREHSAYLNRSGYIKINTYLHPNLRVQWIANAFNSPKSQDPGGLTLEQVMLSAKSARPQNITFNSGEEVSQWRTSVLADWKMGIHNLKAQYFYQNRMFANRLAFVNAGAVNFLRKVDGLQLIYSAKALLLPDDYWQIGVEYDMQNDDRQRYDNATNKILRLDQLEKFKTIGAFVNYAAKFSKLGAALNIRQEKINIKVKDEFLGDGDQSGSVEYRPLSGKLGISYDIARQIMTYANVVSGFETPTLTEIANNPNQGGFADINPSLTKGWEFGIKTRDEIRSHAKLDVYSYKASNELIPYQLQNQPGRIFFRNGGTSKRAGIEISLRGNIFKALEVYGNGSFNTFKLTTPTIESKRLPGIPETSYRLGTEISLAGFRSSFEFMHTGQIYADDQNQVKIAPQRGLLAQISKKLTWSKVALDLSVGARYMFSEYNYNNILINALGSRYYEPLSKSMWYSRLTLDL
jgi:iron complex outermembrane receptor protein